MSEQVAKPAIFELDKYSLFTPVEGNKRASLSFSIRESYPRITVFTRSESDNGGKGMINVAFDLDHFLIFLQRLERLARTEGASKEKATVKYFPRDPSGKIKGDLEVGSELWYGKNEEGVLWLSAVAPNRPKIVFEILLSNFHEFHNSKGETMSKAEGSLARTLVMISVLRYHFTQRTLAFRDVSIPRPKTGPYSQRTKAQGTAASQGDGLDEDVPY